MLFLPCESFILQDGNRTSNKPVANRVFFKFNRESIQNKKLFVLKPKVHSTYTNTPQKKNLKLFKKIYENLTNKIENILTINQKFRKYI